MQENQLMELAKSFVDFVKVVATKATWSRCEKPESLSGHNFIQGPVLMKDRNTKTYMTLSQCSYCGLYTSKEFTAELPIIHQHHSSEPSFNM